MEVSRNYEDTAYMRIRDEEKMVQPYDNCIKVCILPMVVPSGVAP